MFMFIVYRYPLIIKLEQHLDVKDQLLVAGKLKGVFAERLYIPPNEPNAVAPEPCPELFRNRILIAVSKNHKNK
jgi:hypothetical protein